MGTIETRQENKLAGLLQLTQPTLGQAFLTFMQTAHIGKSPKTAKWYRQHVGDMIKWLGEDKPAISVMHADLMDWVSYSYNKKLLYDGNSTRPPMEGSLSINTIHGRTRGARYFFKWLFENEIIPQNPASRLKLPKLPRIAKRGKTSSHPQPK